MNHDECMPCFLLFAKYRGRTGSWCPQLSWYPMNLLNQVELYLYSCMDFCLHYSKFRLLLNFMAWMLRNQLGISSLHMYWWVVESHLSLCQWYILKPELFFFSSQCLSVNTLTDDNPVLSQPSLGSLHEHICIHSCVAGSRIQLFAIQPCSPVPQGRVQMAQVPSIPYLCSAWLPSSAGKTGWCLSVLQFLFTIAHYVLRRLK